MDLVRPIAAVIPGAQRRVLAALAETTAELNLRTLARLSGVSVAQASRVLPGLVELGLVERREVPPSSQFRLVRTHIAARAVLELAAARETELTEVGHVAAALEVTPASVIVWCPGHAALRRLPRWTVKGSGRRASRRRRRPR